jgi:hypothetical protein
MRFYLLLSIVLNAVLATAQPNLSRIWPLGRQASLADKLPA